MGIIRKMLVTAFILVLCASGAYASQLGGKFGMGANWLGFHARYGVTENVLVEGKVQFGAMNTVIGGRGYYIITEIPGNIPIEVYAGGEIAFPISPYITSGFNMGGFGGAEFLLNKNVGLGADLGLYYISLASSLGSISDIGAIANLSLTFYF